MKLVALEHFFQRLNSFKIHIFSFSHFFLLKCSSSCGNGMQIRSVECFDTQGAHNTQCDPTTRPLSVQSCSTGISCTSEAPTTEFEESSSSDNPNETNLDENFDRADDVTEEEEGDGRRKASKSTVDENDDETEEDDDESDMQGDDPRERERNRHVPLAYQYRIPRAERIVDPNAPNEPT
jgi:Thrombospondin type 1 domain